MTESPEVLNERPLSQGDFVNVILSDWMGQVIDFKLEGYNEPQYLLRVWTGSVLFREWFSECELVLTPDEPDDDGGPEADNVINFTKAVKLRKDTPTGGAA